MMLKQVLGLAVCLLLFYPLTQSGICQLAPSTIQGWQVENVDGYISESNGVIRMSTDGGGDPPAINYPSVFLYKQFKPTGDFSVTLQINAQILESASITVRRALPITGVEDGFTFEFGWHNEQGEFLMARNDSGWQIDKIAIGDPHVWYTMQLNVTRYPYTITDSVYDQNGTCIGSFSAGGFEFGFDDIGYIAFGVWGYRPANYLFRSISLSQSNAAQPETGTVDGWIMVRQPHGHYTKTDDIWHLWSDGPPIDVSGIWFLKPYHPTGDFSFSVQVKAASIDRFGLTVRATELSDVGSMKGCNFEFDEWHGQWPDQQVTYDPWNQQNYFLMSRHLYGWNATEFVHGSLNVWYTMQMNVTRSPFSITGNVYDENGRFLGSRSISDMDNFGFDDIKYIGFGVWEFVSTCNSDYQMRIIHDPTVAGNLAQSALSICTQSSSSNAGAIVNVSGTLTENGITPLENRTVVLSYTFPGIDTWIPISSDQTDEQGKYVIQWMNTASGTFTLKAEWSGDQTHQGVSNTTSLCFLPCQGQQSIIVDSNATISNQTSNPQNGTYSFSVTAPTDSTGYVTATVSKSVVADSSDLQAMLDGQPLGSKVSSTVDSWVYQFESPDNTHQIGIQLPPSVAATQPPIDLIILAAIVAIFGSAVAAIVVSLARRKQTVAE